MLACLTGVDLREADLGRVGLKEVDLIGGDLRSSEMNEANLSRAVLLVANLDSQTCRARNSINTLMPDGQRILWGFAGIISKAQDE